MTKPIIVVKVPCKLLYVIQVKEYLIKCSTSWPYLISEFLVAYITIVASDWPHTFLHPRCFCLASGIRDKTRDSTNIAIGLLLKLPIMLLSTAPKSSLLHLNYLPSNLGVNVRFNI